MSTACVLYPRPEVLPRLWATAEALDVHRRKGPHALRLVQPMLAEAAKPAVQEHTRSVRAMPEPELAFYRKYTEAMLVRYMRLSTEAGRVPSLLGREMFQGNVTHCRTYGIDDVVIFVHDVESCLSVLTPGQRALVRRIALQGYTTVEASAMLGISLRTVISRYWGAVDRLTALFVERKILEVAAQA